MLGAGRKPVPVSGTVFGLLEALLAITKAADRRPSTEGVKVTETVQVPPGEMLAGEPQVGLARKSMEAVPDSVIPEMFSTSVPQLVITTDCGTLVAPTAVLVKTNAPVALKHTSGAGGKPVPLRGTTRGLPV
jgi:hypothetical protein